MDPHEGLMDKKKKKTYFHWWHCKQDCDENIKFYENLKVTSAQLYRYSCICNEISAFMGETKALAPLPATPVAGITGKLRINDKRLVRQFFLRPLIVYSPFP